MPTDLAKLQRLPREVGRWQKAQQQLLSGRHDTVLASYRELLKCFQGVVQLWFELGIAAAGQLDFTLAEHAFRGAEQLASQDVSLLVLLGEHFPWLRRL